MATRATYQITTFADTSTIYVHHDGYPEGAAEYFRNTIELMRLSKRECSRDFVPAFLWANAKSMLTASHEEHGDTEWRYNIKWVKNPENTRQFDGSCHAVQLRLKKGRSKEANSVVPLEDISDTFMWTVEVWKRDYDTTTPSSASFKKVGGGRLSDFIAQNIRNP